MPRAVFAVLLFAAASARADLTFTAPAADAGAVRSGVPLTHRFAFVNDGADPVEITGLRATCGCTKPKLDKLRYAPGEKGEIVLDVRTLSQPAGDHLWRLDLAYKSGGRERDALLTLRAKVVVEVAVQPAALTLTTADGGLGHDITLTDVRTKPLSVLGAQSTSPYLSARVASTTADEQGRRVVKVRVAVEAACPDGRHEHLVLLRTDDETYRELSIPVTVVKRPKQSAAASPASVALWAPAGQAAPSRVVLLRPVAGAVAVAGVETDDPAVKCTWASGPNEMATLKISFDRAKVTGELRSAVHVRLAAPQKETITIPVVCRAD